MRGVWIVDKVAAAHGGGFRVLSKSAKLSFEDGCVTK